MAYDLQKKSLGVYDTAYEAAVARARIMGIPAPEKLPTNETPPPAKKVDAMAVAVCQWYESKWTTVESWQTGSIAQKELRDRFCAQTGVLPDHLSVRSFDTMLKTCFGGDVQSAARRCADGKVRNCWLFTPETACPTHLFAGWQEKRREQTAHAAERQREKDEQGEREREEQRRREEEEEEEEERKRLETEYQNAIRYLNAKGYPLTKYNIENWVDLDYDPCAPSDEPDIFGNDHEARKAYNDRYHPRLPSFNPFNFYDDMREEGLLN